MISGVFSSISPILASSGIVYAFKESDGVGQAICVILFIASVVVWFIMGEKACSLNNAMKKSKAFLRAFREKRNPLGMKEKAAESNSPAAAVYLAACERIESFHLEMAGGGRRAMSDDELEVMRSAMNQAVEDQLVILQRRTMILATAVSGSPFLGLFGTVWGITVAFTKLAQAGRADVQTLAPGVSGALLTTVIALLVALPSMIGSNFIASMIKDFTVHLDNFVDEVYAKFKIEQLDSYRASAGNQE
ncbi:MAG: MotA/TolQ/ExbB proton channel family protein [Lentisphaeria bacterium]|jgi:biopolymer transport protein TolQ|nr:MotA/TolQ/ExbB proton channel family protein [Lentisphaeria bacterium]